VKTRNAEGRLGFPGRPSSASSYSNIRSRDRPPWWADRRAYPRGRDTTGSSQTPARTPSATD
jgi:hypothetical protein